MSEQFRPFLERVIGEYIQSARGALKKRLAQWRREVFDTEVNDAVGGLLARQVSLATCIAQSPSIWCPHVLPILLRCMADVYINFCWVVKDPATRSRQFIEYGLGQEKLAIEKYREAIAGESTPHPEALEIAEHRERLLDSERYRFLIPVNLGSWSELSTRDMAIEVDEKQFYDLVFSQFSAAVHSTWQQIWRCNLYECSNPLHMGHRVPFDPDLPPDIPGFTHSAKYLCKTFAKFDEVVLEAKEETDAYECYDSLRTSFAKFGDEQRVSGRKSRKRMKRKAETRTRGASSRSGANKSPAKKRVRSQSKKKPG